VNTATISRLIHHDERSKMANSEFSDIFSFMAGACDGLLF